MNLIKNLAGDLGQVKNPEVKGTMISRFYQADPDSGTRLAKAFQVELKDVKALLPSRTASR